MRSRPVPMSVVRLREVWLAARLLVLVALLGVSSGCSLFLIETGKGCADPDMTFDLLSPVEGEVLDGAVVTFAPDVRGSGRDIEVWISAEGTDVAVFRYPEVEALTIDTDLGPGTVVFDVYAEEIGGEEVDRIERTVVLGGARRAPTEDTGLEDTGW